MQNKQKFKKLVTKNNSVTQKFSKNQQKLANSTLYEIYSKKRVFFAKQR